MSPINIRKTDIISYYLTRHCDTRSMCVQVVICPPIDLLVYRYVCNKRENKKRIFLIKIHKM